jgi:hypothetical protein
MGRFQKAVGRVATAAWDGRGVEDASEDEVAKKAAKIIALLAEIDAELGPGIPLTGKERRSASKIRGDNEVEALDGVLDYADARPELFNALANEDNGVDSKKFETDLLRSRLAIAGELQGVADAIDRVRQRAADAALRVSGQARPVILAAYEIAKPHARRDPAHGAKLSKAFEFYQAIGMASARTRKADEAAKKAAATKTAASG